MPIALDSDAHVSDVSVIMGPQAQDRQPGLRSVDGPQGHGEVPKQKDCPGAATVDAVSSGAYLTDATAADRAVPASVDVAELRRLLSAGRLATYVLACNRDREQALRLYAWNVAVASAFWGGFNVLEVSVRNVIHDELTRAAGREDWWAGRLRLHPFEQQRIADAISAARRAKGAGVLPGHVVAELSFGFWTGLLANRYHQRLWVPALSLAFPYLVGPRRELHRKQESLRKLRNRIAHHEPIFARDLAADHDRLVSVLSAISPAAVTWVQNNSRVPDVLASRASVVARVASGTF